MLSSLNSIANEEYDRHLANSQSLAKTKGRGNSSPEESYYFSIKVCFYNVKKLKKDSLFNCFLCPSLISLPFHISTSTPCHVFITLPSIHCPFMNQPLFHRSFASKQNDCQRVLCLIVFAHNFLSRSFVLVLSSGLLLDDRTAIQGDCSRSLIYAAHPFAHAQRPTLHISFRTVQCCASKFAPEY